MSDTAAHPHISPRQAFRLVRAHLRPVRLPIAAGLLLLVLASFASLALPLAARYVLDVLAAGGRLQDAVVVLVAVVLAAAALQGVGNFLMLRAAEDVVETTRRRLVSRLLNLSVQGMRSQKPGDLMARVTSDTALIRQTALTVLVQLTTGVVVVVGSVAVMVYLAPTLFLVTLLVVALPVVALGFIMPKIRHESWRTRRNVGKMGNELERVLGAYTTVKAASAEDEEHERIVRRVEEARDSGVRTALWNSLAVVTSNLSIQASFLVVLGVGAYRVQSGALSVATLIAFLLYSLQLAQPVTQVTQAVSSFQAGRAALERVAQVDEMQREAKAGPDPDLPDVEGLPAPVAAAAPGRLADLGPVSWSPAAQLEAASFRYPGVERPALSSVTLEIPSSGVTALVGPSGSGKSSVLRLLVGFYPLCEGRVRVAGRDLQEWDLAELRRLVGYVEQETPVFDGSIRRNLAYGIADPGDAVLTEALQRVGLGDRFASLDDEDGEAGYRGSFLSGGERQRLAVARALLRQPCLLLLDEATSQLDGASEARMRDTIHEVSQSVPVVLVAHRLSTVVDAEQIVVMEASGVRAVGRHDELLATDDLYRTLVEEQSTVSGEQAALAT